MTEAFQSWWSSISPKVQVALIAALASLLVSMMAHLWSPISQRKLERIKAVHQKELEETKLILQKQLEESKADVLISMERLKGTLAKDLEDFRASIVGRSEAISILKDGKKRVEESANLAPTAMLIELIQNNNKAAAAKLGFKWAVDHGNICSAIFNDIKPYLRYDNKSSLESQLTSISDDLILFHNAHSASDEIISDLSAKIMSTNIQFCSDFSTIIDMEIETLVKSQLQAFRLV